MSQVLSLVPGPSSTAVMRIAVADGDVYEMGFPTTLALETRISTTEAAQACMDAFLQSGQKDMLLFMQQMMTGAGFDAPYYIKHETEDTRVRIGKQIRALRAELKMDAKTLAQKAEIDAANLCRIEQGKYSVGLEVLSRIAEALDASVELVPGKK